MTRAAFSWTSLRAALKPRPEFAPVMMIVFPAKEGGVQAWDRKWRRRDIGFVLAVLRRDGDKSLGLFQGGGKRGG